jgi:hypothetical protein
MGDLSCYWEKQEGSTLVKFIFIVLVWSFSLICTFVVLVYVCLARVANKLAS